MLFWNKISMIQIHRLWTVLFNVGDEYSSMTGVTQCGGKWDLPYNFKWNTILYYTSTNNVLLGSTSDLHTQWTYNWLHFSNEINKAWMKMIDINGYGKQWAPVYRHVKGLLFYQAMAGKEFQNNHKPCRYDLYFLFFFSSWVSCWGFAILMIGLCLIYLFSSYLVVYASILLFPYLTYLVQGLGGLKPMPVAMGPEAGYTLDRLLIHRANTDNHAHSHW